MQRSKTKLLRPLQNQSSTSFMTKHKTIPTTYYNICKSKYTEILDAPFPKRMVVSESYESSAWMSINLLMIGPDKAIVDETEIPTINFLESLGIKGIRVPYIDFYRFGGSIHCQTSDVRRIGECHNYFLIWTAMQIIDKS
ncbi:Hypothetical predicted protein [Mytilus galloprovincialis]|uniref:Glycine amidinotransferase n=1 Tax=Mytilus galloprovincialis TaxID=29158 RepID=A0A8B6BJH5_MYTGA|nr:Hypothetical predicted protein [Mytilus galloprovincialis]